MQRRCWLCSWGRLCKALCCSCLPTYWFLTTDHCRRHARVCRRLLLLRLPAWLPLAGQGERLHAPQLVQVRPLLSSWGHGSSAGCLVAATAVRLARCWRGRPRLHLPA